MTAADPADPEYAPAKVNLYLHLCGRRADGYHLIDSLVVFPAIGDQVSLAQGSVAQESVARRTRRGLSLEIDGPFAAGLSAVPDNLVLRAARALAEAHGLEPDLVIRLEKHLPVASGIGGGSSDAAATLRLLSRLWDVAIPERLGISLGADVPACLAAPQPRLMTGIGEKLHAPPPLPDFWMVLANPGAAVATGAVFSAVLRRNCPPGLPPPPAGFSDFTAFVDWLARQRNDLQAAAISICPAISEVLAALDDAPIARMSGSGATCFALHAGEAGALSQLDRLRRTQPNWWSVAAPVMVTPAR